MLRNLFRTLLIAGVALGFARSSEATPLLLGKTLDISYYHPNLSTSISTTLVVVDSSVEVQALFGIVNVDVSDTNIRFTFLVSDSFSSVPFSGFVFFDTLGTIPNFTGATLNSTNMSGLTQSRVSFDANHIFVNWQGLPFTSDTFVSVDVAAEGSAAPVPEPATWTLISGGLVLVARRVLSKRKVSD